MDLKDEIFVFLESKGFKIVLAESSSYFGDYSETFTSKDIELKFSSSKSFISIDVRSSLVKDEWYDLALVKALIYNEAILNKVTSSNEYIAFLKKEVDRIINLFENANYNTTKRKLNELQRERVKQMFPNQIQ